MSDCPEADANQWREVPVRGAPSRRLQTVGWAVPNATAVCQMRVSARETAQLPRLTKARANTLTRSMQLPGARGSASIFFSYIRFEYIRFMVEEVRPLNR